MLAMFCLLVMGDAVAIVGGMVFGKLLLGVDYASFYASFVDSIKLWDVTVGLLKGTFFALLIALTSCHYGLNVKGGAVGVGQSVNDAVVAAALLIMVSDDIWTMVLR
jgi:phospholipid/cholesterol/gamma-HCH transport system permease protein